MPRISTGELGFALRSTQPTGHPIALTPYPLLQGGEGDGQLREPLRNRVAMNRLGSKRDSVPETRFPIEVR
ncbi:hypothetical protein [[Phormidium] sp. ETS-05]|uniref:hypothetical protein n=1 Tax=[Phormidium] sp. ETS-05 TaxID=222819 RepID=UPI0018EEFBE1|nr:hypothetical protein [[Phormidium] sp. ETS-05]